MATFRINVIVDPRRAQRGARAVERSLGRIENKADSLRTTLGRAFAVIGAGLAVRQLTMLSDTFVLVRNRLQLVTTDTQNLGKVMDELFDIANRTRVSFDATAKIYTRLALSAGDLGRSQEELLQFTESLNKAVILSGASALEARSALIQLSQGMAIGVLRGDELRSVMEQLPIVADVIADSLGVTRSEVRQLGLQGKITAGIILDAFKKARLELAENFAKTVPTIGQSLAVLGNTALELVGNLGEVTGVSGGLATIFINLAETIKTVTGLAKEFREELQAIFKVSTIGITILRDLASAAADLFKSEDLSRLEEAEKRFETLAKAGEKLRTSLPTVAAPTGPGQDALAQAFADQEKVLKSIRGPQEQARRDMAALVVLMDTGEISAKEYAAALKEIQDAITIDDPFADQVTKLQEGNELLFLRLSLGEDAAEQRKLELELEKQIGPLIEFQTRLLETLIARRRELLTLQEKRAKKDREIADAERKRQRLEEREERAIERIGRRINIQARLLEQEMLINKAREQGRITIEQQAMALADLQLRGLEASQSLEDGFSRAFLKMKMEAEDLAAVGEAVANVFADNVTDALVGFAETGQFAFKEFANAILQDLIRIIARLLVVQALSAAFAPGPGANLPIPGIIGPQPRQGGGTVQPERSFVVGENGPELFVPNRTGTIVPNQKDQVPAAPPVNVQVVNVQSEDDIPNAINSGVANEAIINMLAKEKDRVNQVLQ